MRRALFACVVPLILVAQNYRGNVRPVSGERSRASEISFYQFRFESMVIGREGPTYSPIKTQPVAGREYVMEADISSIDAVSDIRFEVEDEGGRPLQTLVMWKATDSTSEGQFLGLATAPAYPFRCTAIGTDRNGVTLRRTFQRLFRPTQGGTEPGLLPPGIDQQNASVAQQMEEALRRELRTRRDEAARAHPGGVIKLTRARVTGMQYEPYVSASGNPLGIRLRYSIQLETDSLISVVPHVFPAFPAYDAFAWRGEVTMKALGGEVNPRPELIGSTSLADVMVYGAPARYKAGVTYALVVDMVPDYVIQGVLPGGFCLFEQRFESQRARWDEIRASTVPVKYPVSISALDYSAEIPVFYPQRTLYESFVREGARDCGPTPNNRF